MYLEAACRDISATISASDPFQTVVVVFRSLGSPVNLIGLDTDLARDFSSHLRVLGVVLGATIVAYASATFQGPLTVLPLGPMFLMFFLYPVSASGGPLVFALLFFPLYFIICSALSIGLLARWKHAWALSVAIYAILVLGNFAYFVESWDRGIKWQGLTHTWLMLTLNLVLAVVIAFLLARARWQPHRPLNLLAAHASILFWFSAISFPWLGELI